MTTVKCQHTQETFNVGDLMYVTSTHEKNDIVGYGIANNHTCKERIMSKRAHFHSIDDAKAFCKS